MKENSILYEDLLLYKDILQLNDVKIVSMGGVDKKNDKIFKKIYRIAAIYAIIGLTSWPRRSFCSVSTSS